MVRYCGVRLRGELRAGRLAEDRPHPLRVVLAHELHLDGDVPGALAASVGEVELPRADVKQVAEVVVGLQALARGELEDLLAGAGLHV